MYETVHELHPTQHPALSRCADFPAAEDDLPASSARFITRLPLLDGDYRLVGYELRVRRDTPLPVIPGARDLDQIQDEALLTSVIDLDFVQALGHKLILLALAPAGLHSPLLEQLGAERVLLAVPPAPPDSETGARCRELAGRGFRLVVDDPGDLQPHATPIPAHSHVRIDAGGQDAMALAKRAARVRRLGAAGLIAANVDSLEAYEACRSLAFEFVQGYFFTQAPATASRTLHAGRLLIMELLNLVMGRAEFPRIEAKFKLDAGLSYKLLRYINSPAVGLRYPIKSIGQALVMLGHDQLYRWLTLLMFTHNPGDPRCRALLKNAVVRARLTESLGESRLAAGERGGLFIAGILSMLDALLNLPMEQAIAPLKLPQAVVDALLKDEGAYAPYLQLARACEQFDQGVIGRLCARAGLSPEAVNLAHVNALIWSETLEG